MFCMLVVRAGGRGRARAKSSRQEQQLQRNKQKQQQKQFLTAVEKTVEVEKVLNAGNVFVVSWEKER